MFSVSFLKKLKNDIFKNVKNRKKIFGMGIKNLFFLENIFFYIFNFKLLSIRYPIHNIKNL